MYFVMMYSVLWSVREREGERERERGRKGERCSMQVAIMEKALEDAKGAAPSRESMIALADTFRYVFTLFQKTFLSSALS